MLIHYYVNLYVKGEYYASLSLKTPEQEQQLYTYPIAIIFIT